MNRELARFFEDNFDRCKCECEHSSHFRESFSMVLGHAYGRCFAESYCVAVETEFGWYTVCKDCANNCLADYSKEVSP